MSEPRGVLPPSWWTQFRRSLDRLGIKRLSDAQWGVAIKLGAEQQMAPEDAAWRIARLPRV